MSSNKNQSTPTTDTSTSSSNVDRKMILLILSGIGAAVCYIWSFVSISNFVGSKDDWNAIKPQITKIWILTLIGSLCLFIASALYVLQDPHKTMYFLLGISCLSLGLSYSALAISAISK